VPENSLKLIAGKHRGIGDDNVDNIVDDVDD
jgi:hypothetical protein